MDDPSPKIGGIWTPSKSWFLGPFWDHNPNSMMIDSAIFAQVTAECPCTSLLHCGRPFLLKIVPFHGVSGPHPTRFLGPIHAHNANGISITSVVFVQMTAECPYTLQWDARFPSKFCLFLLGDLEPNLIHGSLGSPESSTQTASRSVQPFL